MQRLLGLMLGLVLRLWRSTWRVHVVLPVGGLDGPCVFAFWHGEQMALLGARRRPGVVLVSHSRDGSLQRVVLGSLGHAIERGSSSRGGAQGLRRVVRRMRSAGRDGLFAVDGPRGPRRHAKAGAALAARLAGAALIPLGVAASKSWVLGRSWDGFRIPWPWARVVIVAGPALDPTWVGSRPERIGHAIDRAMLEAETRLAVPRSEACLRSP